MGIEPVRRVVGGVTAIRRLAWTVSQLIKRLTRFHADHLRASVTNINFFDVAVAVRQNLSSNLALYVIVCGVLWLAKHRLTSRFVIVSVKLLTDWVLVVGLGIYLHRQFSLSFKISWIHLSKVLVFLGLCLWLPFQWIETFRRCIQGIEYGAAYFWFRSWVIFRVLLIISLDPLLRLMIFYPSIANLNLEIITSLNKRLSRKTWRLSSVPSLLRHLTFPNSNLWTAL